MLKAIIFDMDGVIVDTEFEDFRIQQAFIMKENPTLNQENTNFEKLIGQSYDMLYKTLRTFIGSNDSLKEIEARFEEYNEVAYRAIDYQQLFRKEIFSILNWSKENDIQSAVASSSTYEHIIEVLAACGIQDSFDVIYSGEFVKESKPNPEIYLNTLKKLNVASNQAVAIEDSFYGISAAKAAGIPTIAYKETRAAIDQSAADYIAEDMTAVFEIVQSIKNLK
ncbi:HAD-IA family hydrolase [Enterococcus raffinosus]|uniref:HAD family hydrolase n=1 Tax=Enterococcus raffinosus TaxID=71452 RepID=UPI001C44C25A|nr:HAD-IA family hydrolase [Enterococcus raffinosus]MDT2570895.1 HAD-IA family hydrolase [Enterococcus raffinosus]QXJ57956.1 HAD-IA family hydrolase [Enterococcus raffinosus]